MTETESASLPPVDLDVKSTRATVSATDLVTAVEILSSAVIVSDTEERETNLPALSATTMKSAIERVTAIDTESVDVTVSAMKLEAALLIRSVMDTLSESERETLTAMASSSVIVVSAERLPSSKISAVTVTESEMLLDTSVATDAVIATLSDVADVAPLFAEGVMVIVSAIEREMDVWMASASESASCMALVDEMDTPSLIAMLSESERETEAEMASARAISSEARRDTDVLTASVTVMLSDSE